MKRRGFLRRLVQGSAAGVAVTALRNVEAADPDNGIRRVDECWMRDNRRVPMSQVIDELGIDRMRQLIDKDRADYRARIEAEFGS